MSEQDRIKDALSKMTEDQVEAIRRVLTSTYEEGPTKLTPEQIKSLAAESAEFHRAQKQVAEAVGVLWNARLDLAIKLGDPEDVQRAMMRPVDFYDNCDCGGTVGTQCW